VNTKERIKEVLKNFSDKRNIAGDGVTAPQIAEDLGIKRNLVSHYLNELCRDGVVLKTNTRPVYFRYKCETSDVEVYREDDIFRTLIGAYGSLRMQVEQCKIAASYPQNGLPVMLTGESGVGKSYIAQLLYEYAKQNKFIKENAPFVIFNCAEYANNPELLTSKLFGYQKGAFTGANNDTPGLIEEANNGYLFLDEVHRLSPEGQEKLFLILDQGIFKRLGESGKWRKVSLRFVFATTEEPEKILLETFLRRIPLQIKIPAFCERPINERLKFIYKFYKDESIRLNTNLEVSKQVLNFLVSAKLTGNIGKLINIVKYSCAYAYKESLEQGSKNIQIRLNNLPNDILTNNVSLKNFNLEPMKVSFQDKKNEYSNAIKDENRIEEMILNLAVISDEFNVSQQKKIDAIKDSSEILNKITDELLFNNEKYGLNYFTMNLMEKSVQEGLKIIEDTYGLKYYGNTANVLNKIMHYFYQNIHEVSKKDRKILLKAEESLKKALSRQYVIARKFLNIIEFNIDYKFDSRVIVYLIQYLYSIDKRESNAINSIIIAHGYSTASSIASVANKLVGQFIFEAFDMPLEVTQQEIINQIKKYLQTVDNTKGLIILVDMGSLENMHEVLSGIVKNDIAIINNITTQIALDVALKINEGSSIAEIVENVEKWNRINCRLIKYDNKKKDVILTTCISGLGTAIKLRDMLKECVADSNIEVLAYDYNKLKNNSTEDNIFKEYNVLLVVGTSKLNTKEVPFILLQDMITAKGEKVLNYALKNKIKDTSVEEINKNIIKKFSLQNLLNRLTILNPDKIIDQVERAISNIEIGVNKRFSNNVKANLLIHIPCLIERLIIKDEIEVIYGHEQFIEQNESFIKLIRDVFKDIANIYKVEIPIGEIQILYEIVNNI